MKSLFVLLTVLSVATFVLASVWEIEDEVSSQRELLGVLLPATPTRQTFNGGAVSSRLCAANAQGECQWGNYAQAIGRLTIPAIVLAPVAFVAFWAFCFGRCCCNGFGGWERTPGNICYGKQCCGSECYPYEFEGYGKGSIWVVRILYILCLVALIAVMIPGFFGNAKVGNGIVQPGRSFLNFADDVQFKAEAILANLSKLPYTSSANSSIQQIVDNIKPLRDTGNVVNDNINKAETYRKPVFIALLIVAPVFFAIGILGGIFNVWKLTFGCGLVTFWVSTLIWLLFAVQYALLIAVNDTCGEITIWNNNMAAAAPYIRTNMPVPNPAVVSVFENLNSAVTCGANSSFTPLQNQARDGITSTYKAACDTDALPSGCLNSAQDKARAAQICGPTSTAIATVNNQTACRLLDFYSTTNNISYCQQAVQIAMDGQFLTLDFVGLGNCQSVTINYCATSCNTSLTNQTKNASEQSIEQLEIASEYIDILTNQIIPLLNCLVFQSLAGNFSNAVCGDISSGGDTLEQSFLGIAIILIPGTILTFLAAKRWRSDSFEGSGSGGMSEYEMNSQKPDDMKRFDVGYNTAYSPTQSPKLHDDSANPAYSPSPSEPPTYNAALAANANAAYSPSVTEDEAPPYSEHDRYDPQDSPEMERLDRYHE